MKKILNLYVILICGAVLLFTCNEQPKSALSTAIKAEIKVEGGKYGLYGMVNPTPSMELAWSSETSRSCRHMAVIPSVPGVLTMGKKQAAGSG